MEYKDFIKILENCSTERVKALSLPESCSLSRVPAAFSNTFSSIVSVLNANLKQICPNKQQVVAIFSLQPAIMALWSKEPHPGRIIDPGNPQHHFCCALTYMLLAEEKLKHVTTWSKAKDLAIDFTTGEIMDENHYLNKVGCHNIPPGIVYGNIDPQQLTTAWAIFNKTSGGLPYGLPIYQPKK